MSAQTDDPPERFLSRWSRRKHEAARAEPAPSEPVPAAPVVAPVAAPLPAPEPLPPIESLTIDSDFTKFLGPKVDESIKRAALKKLFSDPRFNVMDGLDIYIGDYTQPDPMPEGMLDKLKDVYQALAEETEKPPEEAQPTAAAEADAKDEPPA